MGPDGWAAKEAPSRLDDARRNWTTIDQAVDELIIRGVAIQRYEGFQTDDKGVYLGEGPNG